MKWPKPIDHPGTGDRFSARKNAFWFLLLTALAVSLLWPGDHFWGKPGAWQIMFWNYPEQIETIRTALQANQYHEPAAHGVRGSIPVVYHPLHVWIYQLLLLLTPELTTLVFVKQLITLLICLAGLYYLSRALAFPFYPALLVLFSPFIYAYSRQLSDDPWLIPLCLLAFCCYARFYEKQLGIAALAGLLILVLMFFIHPRGLAPAAGFSLMFVLLERRWVRAHAGSAAFSLIVALLLMMPALMDLFGQIHLPPGSDPQSFAPGPVAAGSTEFWLNILFSLVSGGLFFGYDFLQLFPDRVIASGWLSPLPARMLSLVSMTGFVLIACGLVSTLVRLIRKAGNREPFGLEDRFGLVSLLLILLYFVQALLFLLLKKFNPPDYHTGVWFAYFYFLWLAIRDIHRLGKLRAVVYVYIGVMAVLWLNMIVAVHVSSDYNLGEAVRLSKALARYSPESDIVLPVDFTDEIGRELETLEEDAGRAALGFYYRPYIREILGFIDKMRRHRSNLLSYSLYPLTLHYRQAGGAPTGLSRPLVIRWRQDGERRRLELVDDPEAVRRQLEGAEINALEFYSNSLRGTPD
jgi:hypothetical protein